MPEATREYADRGSITAPMVGGLSVTPSDATYLTRKCRGLYVGVAGNVAVTFPGGVELIFTGLSAGIIHPIQCVRIKSTGTTATGILALY